MCFGVNPPFITRVGIKDPGSGLSFNLGLPSGLDITSGDWGGGTTDTIEDGTPTGVIGEDAGVFGPFFP